MAQQQERYPAPAPTIPKSSHCQYVKNPTLSIDPYVLEEQSGQISCRSDLKQRCLMLFWRA